MSKQYTDISGSLKDQSKKAPFITCTHNLEHDGLSFPAHDALLRAGDTVWVKSSEEAKVGACIEITVHSVFSEIVYGQIDRIHCEESKTLFCGANVEFAEKKIDCIDFKKHGAIHI